ncbi:EexN family lipoprotein [Campylobacter jejuni]|uniref:EexN family lipoprotein n=1 Tax=Campylobacter jejuni TaxID=197 RepID=UPI00057730B3|nr:EexN family lipoprotein [Campylobacter jejuni]
MQKLSILLIILIVINMTACDSKTENYYKNHPGEAKEKAKKCEESGTLSEDCINALKVGVKPKNEEDKYSPNTPIKSKNEILETLKQNDFTKNINQSPENNESIIIPPVVEAPSEISPSKITENNQSSIFSDDVNTIQEKLP